MLGAAAVLLPHHHADKYVRRCLDADMTAPSSHYLLRAASCFWVAIDATGDVVGTVAVERVEHASGGGSSPWRTGDAELRRMSVTASARGRSVATALFEELRRFCTHVGYRRIVLSTSTLQRAAATLYPKLGFRLERREHVFGSVAILYFSLDLASPLALE